MSEATVLTNKIINHIYSSGGYAWRSSSTGIPDAGRGIMRTAPKKGVSDVLACWHGTLIAIEVKIGQDRLRPEQEGFLLNVRAAGGRAFVSKTFDDFLLQWQEAITSISPSGPTP
jgi:Holliday junction resolvase